MKGSTTGKTKGGGHHHRRTQVDRYDEQRLSEASGVDESGTFSGYDTTNGQYSKTFNKLLQSRGITHEQVN